MNILVFISYCCILLIIIRSAGNFINLMSNLTWLKRRRSTPETPKAGNDNFIICIPMLREQKIVADTIDYFGRLNYPKHKYKVIVVTTSKEKAGKNIPTTYELAIKHALAKNKKLGVKMFEVLNYPRKDGLMSHQINYAIRKIAGKKENFDSIFAVYNADSRPNPKTLKLISKELQKYFMETGREANIVQQSSIFTLNYKTFPNSIPGYLLKAAALFQTKWTLVHELSRFRAQTNSLMRSYKSPIGRLINTRLTHTVGHGLFVRLKLISREFLPTETINEDLPFGFYQSCKREPVLPFPILENSEVPNSFRRLISQKKVWFYPYLEYGKCRDRAIKLKHYVSQVEVYWLTIQAQITGIIWLFQSLILFLPLLTGIVFADYWLAAIWSLAITFYWFIPTLVIYSKLPFLEKLAGGRTFKISPLDYFFTSSAGLFVLLTHSLGPALAVRDFALNKYFNRSFTKTKTER